MLITFHCDFDIVMKLVILIFSFIENKIASLRDLSKKDSVIKIKCKLKTIDNFDNLIKIIDFIKLILRVLNCLL